MWNDLQSAIAKASALEARIAQNEDVSKLRSEDNALIAELGQNCETSASLLGNCMAN